MGSVMAHYESETRDAYRNPHKARHYHDLQLRGCRWARFATWREVKSVERALSHFAPGQGERLLDLPCGTGIIGHVLSATPAAVVAADISREMMALGVGKYAQERMKGFVQADITDIPFPDGAFAGTIVLGFMHRVPRATREQALREIIRVTRRFFVISFAVDSQGQRVKKWLADRLLPGHGSAPAPAVMRELLDLFRAHGLAVDRINRVAPMLSSEVVCWLKKSPLASQPCR